MPCILRCLYTGSASGPGRVNIEVPIPAVGTMKDENTFVGAVSNRTLFRADNWNPSDSSKLSNMSKGIFVVLIVAAIWLQAAGGIALALQPPPENFRSREISPPLLPVPPEVPAIRAMMDEVSQEYLAGQIATLQDAPEIPGMDALGSRYSFAPGLSSAAASISATLATWGLSPAYVTFTQSVAEFSAPVVLTNVVATLPGYGVHRQQVYIVSGHYDTTGARTPGGWHYQTDPAPGADDDGSGISAMLEIARILSKHQFDYTVRFVAFSGEEEGLWGSQAYALRLKELGEQVAGVFQMDMIAWDSNGDGKLELHAGNLPASQQLATAWTEVNESYHLELNPRTFTANALTASDHSSFWNQGYPAILIVEDFSTDFNIGHYHTTGDTLDTLNLAYMQKMTQATLGTVATLVGVLPQPSIYFPLAVRH
ncbi:MAG: Zn-dependent exopeptidase M28 [Chloroflexi bacterium]|nr:Zn-dependent exopeptidase M28 [Chloroflexota bacterium]